MFSPTSRQGGFVPLGHTKTYLLEETIEVNVYGVPGMRIHEDVFEMTVAKTKTMVNLLCFWGR